MNVLDLLALTCLGGEWHYEILKAAADADLDALLRASRAGDYHEAVVNTVAVSGLRMSWESDRARPGVPS